ncbi:PfkB family carbohydrate kinase [Catellatospora sp. KI3]|nr:PfkB family carbohydrate kinase [Catellatospora sp. KI3]MDI1461408.1 PfkB family carbohydrate kinase [Catellatospora sp. KI3]
MRSGPGIQKPINRLLVVGDVMLDVVGHIGLPATEACAAGHVATDLGTRLGGTGLVVALEARKINIPEVGLWGSVGCDPSQRLDPAGDAAVTILARERIHDLLRREERAPTGTAVCIDFKGEERLLLAQPGANQLVDREGPSRTVLDFAQTSDALFISGYSLIDSARAEQVMTLVSAAKRNGATIALDLVPHRLEDHVDNFERVLGEFDVIFGEAATIQRLYGVGPVPTSPNELRELATRALRNKAMVVLRPSNEVELFVSRHDDLRWVNTGYEALTPAERPGSLDRRSLRYLTGLQ